MLAVLSRPSERSIATSWAGVTLCSLAMMLLMGFPGMTLGRKKFSVRAAHSVSTKKPARRMMNFIVVGGLSSLVLVGAPLLVSPYARAVAAVPSGAAATAPTGSRYA